MGFTHNPMRNNHPEESMEGNVFRFPSRSEELTQEEEKALRLLVWQLFQDGEL